MEREIADRNAQGESPKPINFAAALQATESAFTEVLGSMRQLDLADDEAKPTPAPEVTDAPARIDDLQRAALREVLDLLAFRDLEARPRLAVILAGVEEPDLKRRLQTISRRMARLNFSEAQAELERLLAAAE